MPPGKRSKSREAPAQATADRKTGDRPLAHGITVILQLCHHVPGACSYCRTRKTRCEFLPGADACNACIKSNRANDCVPQESHTRPRSHGTPPTDSQQVSQGRGRRKKVTGMATGVQSISSQAKECRSGLKAQGRSADAPPTFTMSLHPICESEDAYDSGTGAFQQFVPSVAEYISGITGHDSDVEMDGSEGEFDGGTDTDISLNVDDGDNISDDELDGDITRLMYHLKPAAARGAPKYQKRQPGKPKGISKPALMDPVSDDEPKTCGKL